MFRNSTVATASPAFDAGGVAPAAPSLSSVAPGFLSVSAGSGGGTPAATAAEGVEDAAAAADADADVGDVDAGDADVDGSVGVGDPLGCSTGDGRSGSSCAANPPGL